MLAKATSSSSGGAVASTRALRSEYLLPSHKEGIPDTLMIIEQCMTEQMAEDRRPKRPSHRDAMVRFASLFKHGELFPPVVFIASLEMADKEEICGAPYEFSPETHRARDQVVYTYQPLVAQVRRLRSKEISGLPEDLMLAFFDALATWESLWLRDRETHAVDALQALAGTILSLQPFLASRKKEILLPHPRVLAQRQVSYRALIGFLQALGKLSGMCLSSLKRELCPDPRLFLLLDFALLQADKSPEGAFCVRGMSATPDIFFNDSGVNLRLETYAFRLYNRDAGCEKGSPNEKIVKDALLLLNAFERVKDEVLRLKASDLNLVNPQLDRDMELCNAMEKFEMTFKKMKKLYLEPDNLF